jgi:hypothetical protein
MTVFRLVAQGWRLPVLGQAANGVGVAANGNRGAGAHERACKRAAFT